MNNFIKENKILLISNLIAIILTYSIFFDESYSQTIAYLTFSGVIIIASVFNIFSLIKAPTKKIYRYFWYNIFLGLTISVPAIYSLISDQNNGIGTIDFILGFLFFTFLITQFFIYISLLIKLIKEKSISYQNIDNKFSKFFCTHIPLILFLLIFAYFHIIQNFQLLYIRVIDYFLYAVANLLIISQIFVWIYHAIKISRKFFLRNKIMIAIDGPSASGKGSVAKKLASHYNLPYLNTGSLYRACALRLIKNNISLEDFQNKIDIITKDIATEDLENEELFLESTGEIASVISQNKKLRKALLSTQKIFIKKSLKEKSGVILDGRDISSVIMPYANYKFYITANIDSRAQRRFDQLKAKDINVSYEEIFQKLIKRDENDINRKNSALVIDKDAIIIDNSNINAQQTFEEALKHINRSTN